MDFVNSPSPNFGPRRGVAAPDMVVLHCTAMPDVDAALARLSDPVSEVSAHYLIGEDGTVWRLVEEEHRAWHAGLSAWGGVRDVNSHSIGIELANAASLAANPPFPEPQMGALEALLADIVQRWRIAPARVLAHSDVAPGRKADPGPKFDWRRLALQGLSVWPAGMQGAEVAGDPWTAFKRSAERAGYRSPAGGGWPGVLEAVRLRFRPAALGARFDVRDATLLAALAREHPCIDPDAPSA
ncbi:MAG: N-acetylmuramoyl-L-alanine amidase [Paracoccaceae bacterium]